MTIKEWLERRLTKEEALKMIPVCLAVTVGCSLGLTVLIQTLITAALGGNV